MFKLPYSSTHLTVSKVMLKILQARLHQKFPDVQAGFRKGRGTNIHWIIVKARDFKKKTYFCFIDYTKAFDCVNHKTRKFFKRWEYQTMSPASWEICIQVLKQQLEQDIEQQTGSKLGNEYVKAVHCHLAYLIIGRVHHAKCRAGWSTSWNQHCWEKY